MTLVGDGETSERLTPTGAKATSRKLFQKEEPWREISISAEFRERQLKVGGDRTDFETLSWEKTHLPKEILDPLDEVPALRLEKTKGKGHQLGK